MAGVGGGRVLAVAKRQPSARLRAFGVAQDFPSGGGEALMLMVRFALLKLDAWCLVLVLVRQAHGRGEMHREAKRRH